jgi:8-oxo-dGTP diphosphatase
MSYSYEYPRPAVTADAVIFKVADYDRLNVLLIKRQNDPYKDQWALPGGFIDQNETLEQCVEREVKEETGISGIKFYQLEAFSQPERDPRHRTITIAFWGFCKDESDMAAGSDATTAKWFEINEVPDLAFDHEKILKKALVRALAIMAQ